MSRKMFKSKWRGCRVETLFVPYDYDEKREYAEKCEKERAQARRPKIEREVEEKRAFFEAIGRKPSKNDKYSIMFNIGYRQGKTGLEIAESVFEEEGRRT